MPVTRKILFPVVGMLVAVASQMADAGTATELFSLSNVRLTDGIWKEAQQLDVEYLKALDADRLLAPYMKEAGLTPKAENYSNWENTGLDGHIGGHYLSALSQMWAATGDPEIKQRLDYVVSELRRCQDASGNGYLCGVPGGKKIWDEISRGDIRAGGFDLNGGWVPLYNIHKIFAGLRDAWVYAGDETARSMLIKLTDWMAGVTENLSDDQMQDMLRSEHGGLNEVFADVAAITGDSKYLRLARRFSHRAILEPLLNHSDNLTGLHANTQIPKVIGFKRIAETDSSLTEDWTAAARFFHATVTQNRSICIGGNSVREHFHPADDFSTMLTSEQGPETCNTYNMLRLTKMLYLTDCNSRLVDYYEIALINHILSSQNHRTGGLVYFTPMRPGHYRVYSQPQTSFWCCVGSGLENHARYGEMIYAHNGADTLVVNLFISSELQWHIALKGKDAIRKINQATRFPEEGATSISIAPAFDGERFSIKLRIPQWVAPGTPVVAVNGKPEKVVADNGYVTITRKWKRGDTIVYTLPMHLGISQLPDGSDNYAFLYGPVVLAANVGTEEQSGLFADDSRGGHIASGRKIPLHEMPAIIEDGKADSGNILAHLTPVAGKPLAFTLSGLTTGKDVVLEPFYKLNECRYIVYWPAYNGVEWLQKQKEIAAFEAERAALEAITADVVTLGEQQPESDHFVKLDNTWAWDDDGRHFREAWGSMSYTMKHRGLESVLRITYRPENGKDASVVLDGTELGAIDLPDVNENRSEAEVELPLPNGLPDSGTVEICLKPRSGKVTPHIYELRIIKR